MTTDVYIKGTIIIQTSDQKKHRWEYVYKTPCPKIKDTLMSEFNNLELNHEEKQQLTLNHRKKLFRFLQLHNKAITSLTNKFVKELKQYRDESIKILAKEEGAHICLAALFSGKLSGQMDWKFEFSDVPLKLFPEKLIKKPGMAQMYDISFSLDQNSWLRPFQTLYERPPYLQFKNSLGIENAYPHFKVA
jgi:hypothetical protein